MSSTGPGSLLVFLAFLMLSMLLVGTYFTAYFGLLQAGGEVQKAGEAAVEQAIIYLFQYPTEVTIVNGNPVVKGETRIVIQNVGSKDITFDRILAISPGGSVVADVKVPGNKGLGVRQWQMYRVQDLGLPDRWSNFDTFRSEVARLVLLSERGKTHGSIWGVPPFLEGVLKAVMVVTVTGSETAIYTVATPRPSSPSPQQPSSPQPQGSPSQETRPLNCTEVLNDPSKKGSREWCYCAKYNAPKLYEENIDLCEPPQEYCLVVFPEPCCSGGVSDPSNAECVSGWSSSPGSACATFKPSELKNGVKRELVARWGASWTLKQGWYFAGAAPRESGVSCSYTASGNSVTGTCRASVPPGQYVHVVVVFYKAQSTTTTTSNPSSPSGSASGSFGSGSSGSPSGSSSSSSSGSSSSSSSSPSSSSSSSGGGGSGSGSGGGGGSGSSGAGGGSSSGGSTGGSSSGGGGGGGGFGRPPVYLI
jgi:hypothetical protein